MQTRRARRGVIAHLVQVYGREYRLKHVFQPELDYPWISGARQDLAGIGGGETAVANISNRKGWSTRITKIEMIERVQKVSAQL